MRSIKNRALVSSLGNQATCTAVATKTTRDMATVKCTGLMALATKAIGRMESSTGLAR
jgi:hypothetical protein